MKLEKQCKTCEFNFDGICAGYGDTYKYGEKIVNDTKYCDGWKANLKYFNYETKNAPRFLREQLNDCSISYDEFSSQFNDYTDGKDVPINFFDAVKYIYGISMVDIAVFMDVSFGVVYNAKVKGIPTKRIKQFSEALCVESEILMANTTAVFNKLSKSKDVFFAQSNINQVMNTMPEWKQELARVISSNLRCPIHIAKDFARVDKFYWTKDMPIDDFTESEKALLNFAVKHNAYHKPLIQIEYSLDRACLPHIHMSMYKKDDEQYEVKV